MAAPANVTPGRTRYLTITAIFPGDNEAWVDQVAFVAPLDFWLKSTSLLNEIKFDLLMKGEARHRDNNGMTFLYRIEFEKRDRAWGKKPKELTL